VRRTARLDSLWGAQGGRARRRSLSGGVGRGPVDRRASPVAVAGGQFEAPRLDLREPGLGARPTRRLVDLELPVAQALQRLAPLAIGVVDAGGDEEAVAARPLALGMDPLHAFPFGGDALLVAPGRLEVDGALAGGDGGDQRQQRTDRAATRAAGHPHVREVSTERRASAR
jgi:hypothetical protein